MTRQEIEQAIVARGIEIKRLENEIRELTKQSLLLCDETQWFTEKEEDVKISKRPKKFEKKLMGRIHWNEDFVDGDTGEVVTIERSQLVRVDGKWL